MFPRETVSFVFQRVLMFPSTSSRETSGLEEKKLTSFPRDHTSSALLHNYLDFPLNNHGEKTCSCIRRGCGQQLCNCILVGIRINQSQCSFLLSESLGI